MTMPRSAVPHSDEYWRTFDSTDAALIVSALDELGLDTLAPEARSRLIELRSIFIQRETGYYGS